MTGRGGGLEEWREENEIEGKIRIKE